MENDVIYTLCSSETMHVGSCIEKMRKAYKLLEGKPREVSNRETAAFVREYY